MVFLHHSFTVFSSTLKAEPAPGPVTDVLTGNGFKGIFVFFVLSGFILALPFIKWRNGTGERIVLKQYYLRRITRLEPPYILSLLIGLVLAWDSAHAADLLKHLLAAVFYLHNIIYGRWGNLNPVAWTLEIEAQFYLLAPVIFSVFLLPRKARRLLLAAISFAFCLARCYYRPDMLTLYHFLPYFLLGSLLADVYADGRIPLLDHPLFIALALLLYGLVWALPVNNPIAIMVLPFIVAATLGSIFNNAALQRLFSAAPLAIIGGMCYSIYLLHNHLLYFIANITRDIGSAYGYWPAFFLQLPIYAAFVLAVCSLYFVAVERPFMQYRRRKLPVAGSIAVSPPSSPPSQG